MGITFGSSVMAWHLAKWSVVVVEMLECDGEVGNLCGVGIGGMMI